MAIELPPGHKRPKIKFKRVAKPKPPPMTAEERAAFHLEKTEARYGINPSTVNAVIMASHGLLTVAAEKLKMSRDALSNYIDKNPACAESLEQARAVMGDVAEGKLFELIKNGDVRCILYYLSTVQRHRGYGQNTADAAENNTGRGPVYVNIVGVPSGTFLPKVDNKTIEHTPTDRELN
jgi:hypothetical protein